ncbi:hypothetical protein H072_2610 [Dactylellina haptotyla CBS 200.50]|uniref:Uncharacterized protein n=1 Tax=Dactylellina haptotyla (strain CBS 200.50) TaxID=1284197 RepID=S8AQR2_DACHA|nr:hypothetical protein H072_2610 [Dactylellina haptotyla CBS 200.50]
MPTENTQWIIADDAGTEEPNIAFAKYALWNWRSHLRKLLKSISPEDKAFVITSIYNILTNPTIIASHFQNPANGIDADTSQEYIIEGDFWDPILTWIQDQEGLNFCSPKINTWATNSNQNRSLLMEPSVNELYRLLLSGKIFPIHTMHPPFSYRRPLDCIAIYLSKYQDLLINPTDWLEKRRRRVCLEDVLTIVERPNMKQDAIWYASVANMLYLANLGAITESVSADYYSRALSEHRGIDGLGVVLRAKLARAYNRLYLDNPPVPSTFQDDENPIKLMEDAISMAERIHPNLDALGYSELRAVNVAPLRYKTHFVLRPWVCSRRELAGMVADLAEWKLSYQKVSPSTPEERNALWEKAFMINPHSDDILNHILAYLPPAERHKELAKMYQMLSGLESLKEPPISRLTEHLISLATSSGLSQAHEILSTAVGNREFSYRYLQEVLEILKAQGDVGQIAKAELAIGNIYEADGDAEKAIEFQEKFIAKCIFRNKSGGLKFNPKLGSVHNELRWIISKIAESISVILSDGGRPESSKLPYVEKLKQLDGFNSIFMATPGYHFHYETLEHILGPVVALGLYYWLAGDKDTSTKYLKKCIQQSLQCFKDANDVGDECFVNRNYLNRRYREWAHVNIAAIG